MIVKRHTWSDIKARIKPETRTRLEADGRRLAQGLRDLDDADEQTPHPAGYGRSGPCEPGKDSEGD